MCGWQWFHLEKQLFSTVQSVLCRLWQKSTVEDLYSWDSPHPSQTSLENLHSLLAPRVLCPFIPTSNAAASSGQVLPYLPGQGPPAKGWFLAILFTK